MELLELGPYLDELLEQDIGYTDDGIVFSLVKGVPHKTIRIIQWDRGNVKRGLKQIKKLIKKQGIKEVRIAFAYRKGDGENILELLKTFNYTCIDGSEGKRGEHIKCFAWLGKGKAAVRPTQSIGKSIRSTETKHLKPTQFFVFTNVPYTFQSHLAPEPYEKNPFVHFYLSHPPGDGTTIRQNMYFEHYRGKALEQSLIPIGSQSSNLLKKYFKGSDASSSQAKESNTIKGTLLFALPMYYAPKSLEDVYLNIACYCTMLSEAGEDCVNQCGCAQVSLKQLLDIRTRTNVELPLKIPALDEVTKAVLTLEIDPGNVGIREALTESQAYSGELSKVPTSKVIDEPTAHSDANLHYIFDQLPQSSLNDIVRSRPPNWRSLGRNLVEAYSDKMVKFVNGIPFTYPGISNIHTFLYKNNIGLLPSAVFFRFKTPPLSEQYWINLIHIALERIRSERNYFGTGNPNAPTFEEYTNGEANDKLDSLIFAICTTLYVNCCKYITDIVDRNDRQKNSKHDMRLMTLIESFDFVRMREACDCEDCARESMNHAFSLDLLWKTKGTMLHPSILRLCMIRKKYFCASALGGVAAQQINQDYSAASFGAHEFLMIFSKLFFLNALKRGRDTTKDIKLFSTNPLDPKKGEHINQAVIEVIEAEMEAYPENFEDLEPLVCEGTGMLWPQAEEDRKDKTVKGRHGTPYDDIGFIPAKYERVNDILEDSEALKKDFRKMFRFSKTTGSAFYKNVTHLFTNEFFQDHPTLKGLGEFIFVYPKTNRTKCTYGVDFVDLLNMSDKVMLLAAPKMSDELVHYIDAIQADEHPERELPPPYEVNNEKKLRRMKVLEENLAEFIRRTDAPISDDGYKVTRFINYYAADDTRISALSSALRTIEKQLHARVTIEIYDEPVTMSETGEECIGVYRFVIYVEGL